MNEHINIKTLIAGLLAVAVALSAVSGLALAAGLTADYTATPNDPYTGENVTFDASTSTGTTSNTTYEWDFDGDGTYEANGSEVVHSFSSAGNYSVTLKITENGSTDTYTQTISVHEKQSYEINSAVGTVGNASEINVVVNGQSQSHDLIVNGEFATTLEEGATVEFVYINSSGDAVAKSNVSVGDGNVTGLALDDATVDYTETVAATGGGGSSSSNGILDEITAEVIAATLAAVIISVVLGGRRGGS